MDQRSLVVEHRVTRRAGRWLIRFWIEGDPAHGGVDAVTAHWICGDAVHDTDCTGGHSDRIARILLVLVPSANSVEVVDEDGNGTALHRDWP